VFVAQENIVCTLKWPSLIAKNRKSLVRLTPGLQKNDKDDEVEN
jgi:hypothetical protein